MEDWPTVGKPEDIAISQLKDAIKMFKARMVILINDRVPYQIRPKEFPAYYKANADRGIEVQSILITAATVLVDFINGKYPLDILPALQAKVTTAALLIFQCVEGQFDTLTPEEINTIIAFSDFHHFEEILSLQPTKA